MAELLSLFAVLVTIYLWECVVWFDGDSILLDIRAQPPSLLRTIGAGDSSSHFVISNVYPPFAQIAVCPAPSIFVSSEGISYPYSNRSSFTAFEEITEITSSNRTVYVNGRRMILKTISATHAANLVSLLDRLRGLPKPERIQILDAGLKGSMDVSNIQSKLALYYCATGSLKLDSAILFLTVFLVFPILLFLSFESVLWPLMLFVLLLAVGMTARDFDAAAKAISLTVPSDRLTTILAMLASPLSAMRAQCTLARGLLEEFDQVAVVRSMCGGESPARETAAVILRKLHYAPRFSASSQECSHYSEWCERYTGRILELLGPSASLETLLTPPSRQSDSASYCPYCHCQYVLVSGACSDCDIPLVTFTETGEQKKASGC